MVCAGKLITNACCMWSWQVVNNVCVAARLHFHNSKVSLALSANAVKRHLTEMLHESGSQMQATSDNELL